MKFRLNMINPMPYAFRQSGRIGALSLIIALGLAACGGGGPDVRDTRPSEDGIYKHAEDLEWYDYGPDPAMAGQPIQAPEEMAPPAPAQPVPAYDARDEVEIASVMPGEDVQMQPEPGSGGYYAGSTAGGNLQAFDADQLGYGANSYGGAAIASLGRPVKIAILAPLSGPSRGVGQALVNAAEMALFSIGDAKIELMPRDTEGKPDVAARAAQDAIYNGADVIIGPLFASSVQAVAPIAQRGQVVVLAFSNDRSVAAPGVFLLGFLPEQQVARVVRFAHRKGLRRFAALYPQSAYGERVERAFNGTVADIGSVVTDTAYYEPIPEAMFGPVRHIAHYDERVAALDAEREALAAKGDKFSLAALKRLEGKDAIGSPGFDAILLPEGGNNLRSLAPLLPYYEVDPKEVRFLGTGLWGEPGLGLEPSLQGGWYAGPPPDVGASFMDRYKALYGNQPPRLVTMAFDAVALVATLSRAAGPYKFAPRAFVRPEGFAGIDGIFRLHRDGLNERGLAIIEVLPRGVKVVDPAPRQFNLYDAEWQREMTGERGLTRFPSGDAASGY